MPHVRLGKYTRVRRAALDAWLVALEAGSLIYADYQPTSRKADLVDDAFRGGEIASVSTADSRASRE